MSVLLVNLVFAVFGVLAVAAAVLTARTRHVVRAALWLALCLGALAGCYLMLTAEFVAWVQVLIYVGAVAVLLLFALMLTRAPTEASDQASHRRRWPAALVALAVAGVLAAAVVVGFRGETIEPDRLEVGTPKVIGTSIFSHWVLAFELLSVLLLAALVGAIAISRRVREAARAAEEAP